MTTTPIISVSPLTADAAGLGRDLDRTAQGLPKYHHLRELIVNGFEADATSVWIDAYEEDETGRC